MNNNLYNNGYIPSHGIIPNMNNYQDNYSNDYNNGYVEGYLKNNLGKRVEAHVSFSDSIEWRDSVFTGILEDVGKDYMVIKNNQNSYIIWNVYVNYVVLLGENNR